MEAKAATSIPSSSLSHVLGAIARGVTVLTPTAQAARQLVRTVDTAALERGDRSWRSPSVLPWSAWSRTQWNSAIVCGLTTRVLLNSTQERAVWIRLITEATMESPLLAASQAEVCMRAFRLLATFGAESAFRSGQLRGVRTADMETFHRWYLRFHDVCLREDYLSPSAVDKELAALFAQRQLACADEYLLYGFADLTPSRRNLVDALRHAGATVKELQPSTDTLFTPALVQYASRESQLRACAQWVRSRLEQHPEQTIAIVTPNLAKARSEVERELRLVVSPASANVLNSAPLPYEFSSGHPLQSLPLVQHAQLLLRWCCETLSLDDACRLLRSPHLTLAESSESGAVQDEPVLRKSIGLRKQLSLHRAAVLLRSNTSGARLPTVQREAAQLRRADKQTFAWFADRIPALLATAGWPGPAPLNNDEQEAADTWQRALDDVASLDLLGRKTDWPEFLTELNACVEHSLFKPEHRGRPVQVLTLQAAEGITADALWCLYADADSWTEWPAENTLLPRSLQRDFGMPGTEQERDAARAAGQLRHLLHGVSGEARLSWSADAAEGAGMPSPVVEQVVLALGGELRNATEELSAEPASSLVEQFVDITPLPALPDGDTAGGVSVLTAQALCGFRAWAEKRVFAAPADPAEDGLSPKDRGNQVHEVLQKFWEETKTHAELGRKRLQINADGQSERDRLLRACIADVCRSSSPAGWDAAYLLIQQQRLFRLLKAWLDVDEQRPPFKVADVEKTVKHVPIGPLRLQMRVDRIDTILAADEDALPRGNVLIDYKTGNNTHSDWEGDRPSQPQLPAYAIAAAHAAGVAQVDGIAFASILAGQGKAKLDSVAEPGLLPPRSRKDPMSFDEHMAEWQGSVTALAEAFANGDVPVDPKLYPQTCKTCAQRILCRLDVASLLQTDPDELEFSLVEAE